MKYPVHERFFSWQGEGVHMGRSAFFIRLFGCPIHCPWCDSAGTWHPDHIPQKIDKFEPYHLVEEVLADKPDFVVITGGEPTIHNLSELTHALKREDIAVHLETSGAFKIHGEFDWITLSPKWNQLPLEENFKKASEFKCIIEEEAGVQKWWDFLEKKHFGQPVWLHPEWGKSKNKAVLNAITSWVKSHGNPFRAGFQMHKLYSADSEDQRAR